MEKMQKGQDPSSYLDKICNNLKCGFELMEEDWVLSRPANILLIWNISPSTQVEQFLSEKTWRSAQLQAHTITSQTSTNFMIRKLSQNEISNFVLGNISSTKNDKNLTNVTYVLTRFLCRKRTSTSSSGKSARRSNCSQQWDSPRLASVDCTYVRALCFVHCTLLPVLLPRQIVHWT